MGIATGQARFLAITSRKANCEFESMRIAQQKLSVTRDLAKASDKYQQSLNTTKLVWNASNDGSQTFDLNYDVMMGPSVLNGYEPYLITDAKTGQVALNSRMASAAKAAGIGQTGATRSKAGRDMFIKELSNQGYISGSMAQTIKDNPYSNAAGMGGKPLEKTAANAVTGATFMNYLKDAKGADNQKLYSLKLSDLTGVGEWNSSAFVKGCTLVANGQIMSDTGAINNLTIGDLLEKNYVLVQSKKDPSKPFEEIVGNFINQLAGQLGYGHTKTGLNTDDASNSALNYAYGKISKDFFSGDVKHNAGNSLAYKSVKNNANIANNYNAIVETDSAKSVSLTNIAKSFLTAYAQALTGQTGGYSLNKEAGLSNYVTDDPTYYYVLNNDEAVTEKDLLITDFYNALYNNICSKGWTEKTEINDKDYLQNALKNGQLFIASMGTDGYYYQAPYVQSGFYSQGCEKGAYVVEVTDEDAIARAEADYTKEKNKLNYKEQLLELDMKNIDTELSALTTEYDTVKNLISKNIEKIFNMFQS